MLRQRRLSTVRIAKPALFAKFVALLACILVLSACERTEVNGIGSYTGDELHPPQLDVGPISSCAPGDWGFATARTAVVNNIDDVASYEIVIAFESGDTRLRQSSAWIRDLDAGQSANVEVTTHLGDDVGSLTSCRTITVNRWEAATTG